jgi:ABC-type transporter lipoprotein component MlaA
MAKQVINSIDWSIEVKNTEVETVEKAIEDIETAMKGDDVETIAKAVADSYEACKPLNEKVVEAQQAAQPETKTDDGAVDAEFTEEVVKNV